MKSIMARLQKEPPKDQEGGEITAEPQKKEKKAKEPKIKKLNAKKIEENRRRVLMPKDEKLKKPKASQNVLLFNSKKHQQASPWKKIRNVLIDTFYEFAGITKVNGMYYLRRFVTRGWLRLLWSCIMIGLLSFAATLIYLLYRRYLDSPTRVTIDSPKPINLIPFPGVTICHPQNVMEYKSRKFVKDM